MVKRLHTPTAKPGELRAKWGRPSPGDPASVCYVWGGSGAEKPDARILSNALEDAPVFSGRSLAQELEARGYDLSTLQFSVKKKEQAHD
jgi:hypothetical protein